MFNSLCENCRTQYRWTRKTCPRCWRPNENTPGVFAGKVFCVLLICAAVWLTVQFVALSKEQAAGVVPPMPEKERPGLRLSTP
jgi:predicted amidophosphoribosyltransferase